MMKLREVINFKAAVVGAVFLSALSGFVSESAEATNPWAGESHSGHTRHDSTGKYNADPPPGTFFDGRITVRYDREKVLPISEFGWFGDFSNSPEATFPDTGDGIFADANAPFNLLPPNEKLSVSVCTVQSSEIIVDIIESRDSIIICEGDAPFDPFESLPPPGEQFSSPSFSPDDFPEDDFFAVNFDFGEDGLTIDTEESFNFFGFSYQFNQEAFEDKVVGISLVESGTGDLGLVPLEGFNIINCIPQDSPESDFATERCGEPDFPLDVEYVTQEQILSDSNNPDFFYDFDTREGTLSNDDPFQLFDDSFLPRESVDEPHNNLGLIALGLFGAKLAFKRRRKE